LPLSLLCLLATAWQTRLKWPLYPQQQALLLWGLWLLPQTVFFSYAGLFHRYYLEMMAPAIAALVGTGLVAMWRNYGWLLPLALVGSAGFEMFILWQFPEWAIWLVPLSLGFTLLAALGIVLLLRLRLTRWIPWFGTLGLLAMLIPPAVWAAIPVWQGGDSGLPFAGPDLLERRGPDRAQNLSRLIDYLFSNRSGEKFILATLSAQTAAPVILVTGEPVMALGGFSGGDQILTTQELEAKVLNREVSFFLLPEPPRQPEPPTPWRGRPPPPGSESSNGKPPMPPPWGAPVSQLPQPGYPFTGQPPPGKQSELVNWVQETCRPVPEELWGGAPGRLNGFTELERLWDCGS